jgi:hypothetical protein
VGIIGIVFMQPKLTRMAAWLSVGLVILFYFLCLLKIHFSFNFIPFHSLEKFLDRQIKFKWGWWLLCAGPVMALAGSLFSRPKFKMPDQPKSGNTLINQE